MSEPTHDLEVLLCDNHVLVVRKPAGVPTQADESGDPCLLEIAREWVRRTFDKPGNVFLGLVHRLDRPVEGVVVFARTSKGAARLSEQLRERRMEKVYLAIVLGATPPGPVRLQATLDGRECALTFRTLASNRRTSQVEVRPETGRKHQIRRQLAAAGHPILGDLRYGAPEPLPERRIALFAQAVAFDHPTRGERIRVEATLPKWWPAVT